MHRGHRARMRKKFLNNEFECFESHEILEFLLSFAIPRRDTNKIGHELMDSFGYISSVFDAPLSRLTEIDGIGESAAILLKTVVCAAKIYMEDKHSLKNRVIDKENAGDTLVNKFIGKQHEVVILTLMDAKSKVIFCGIVNEGNMNSVEIYIKKVMEFSVFYNARYAIIAHNHPSGVALPSRNDIESTKKLIDALKLINVELLDHIIVSDGDYVSLAQSELIKDLFN